MYKGARLHVPFARSYFAGTKYERVEREEIFTLKVNRGEPPTSPHISPHLPTSPHKVNRGEPEGATYWHRSQGDVGRGEDTGWPATGHQRGMGGTQSEAEDGHAGATQTSTDTRHKMLSQPGCHTS